METGTGRDQGSKQVERVLEFLQEAGRRRVWRTAITYAAVVFILLQVGEIVLPAFGAPSWALRLLVVLCFLGFPPVLALAWAFDLTPSGILRAESGDGPAEGPAYSGATLPRLALVAVILATVGGLGWWSVRDTLGLEARGARETASGGIALASPADTMARIRSLAVLPLKDFSSGGGGEHFTAGFHEELVASLGRIGATRVLSRTSVVEYDAQGKTMPTIASELGVEGVVEGSVFRDGNRVRITVQLIHGPTDRHLWANSYEGTLEDAIRLQDEVAGAITREIRAELASDQDGEARGGRVAGTDLVHHSPS